MTLSAPVAASVLAVPRVTPSPASARVPPLIAFWLSSMVPAFTDTAPSAEISPAFTKRLSLVRLRASLVRSDANAPISTVSPRAARPSTPESAPLTLSAFVASTDAISSAARLPSSVIARPRRLASAPLLATPVNVSASVAATDSAPPASIVPPSVALVPVLMPKAAPEASAALASVVSAFAAIKSSTSPALSLPRTRKSWAFTVSVLPWMSPLKSVMPPVTVTVPRVRTVPLLERLPSEERVMPSRASIRPV